MESSDDDSGAPTVPSCLHPPRPASHARARPYRRRKPPSPTSHRDDAVATARASTSSPLILCSAATLDRSCTLTDSGAAPPPGPPDMADDLDDEQLAALLHDFHLHNDGVEEDRGHDAVAQWPRRLFKRAACLSEAVPKRFALGH